MGGEILTPTATIKMGRGGEIKPYSDQNSGSGEGFIKVLENEVILTLSTSEFRNLGHICSQILKLFFYQISS